MPRGPVSPDDQIDSLIEKRSREKTPEAKREELWQETVRQYHRARKLAFTQAWQEYYANLAVEHRRLSEENQERADFLEEYLGGRRVS